MNDPSAAPASAGPPPLEILVLGGFVIRGLGGQGLGQTEGRTHVRALLALAAASRAGVARDEVADVLWPRLGEAAARNRLYHTMHLARQALGAIAWPDEWLQLRHGRVQLDPRVRTDAHDIERLLDRPLDQVPETDLLMAIDQCRGEWAPEVDAGGLGHTVRRQLHDAHVALLTEAARRRVADGDVPVRRQLLERILDIHATDEWAYQQLMQLDLEAGRYHGTLRRFEAAGRALGQRLGLRPSRMLADLAAEAASRIGPDADPGDHPASPGDVLIDREPLVREMVRALEAGPGIWNVHGLGGVGKTALVREVTRRSGPRRPEGVVVVSFGDGTGSSVSETLCRAAGLDPESELSPEAGVAMLLGTRDMLLVLDDLDSRPDGVALLSSVPAGMKARVVCVTHLPVVAAGVHHVAVHPLRVPDADAPLMQARLSPAIAFYRLRRPVADAQEWSDAHWAEVIALVRKLDGLPLAIEVAAARSATMTAGEILAQLEAGPAMSDAAGAGAGQDVHGPVRAAIALSMRLLRPDTRLVLHAVAALPGWFRGADAVAVAAAAGFPRADALTERLEELADAGLLERRDAALRMLHLTRDEARRDAVEAGTWNAIRRARIDTMVGNLEADACDIESPGYTRWLEAVLRCHDEALPLLEEVGASDPALFLRLLVPLMHSWAVRGLLPLSQRWGPIGIDVADAVSNHEAGIALRVLTAITLIDGRHFEDALARTRDALAMADAPGASTLPPVLRAQLITVHAEGMAGAGPLDEALAGIDAALESFGGPEQPGWWTLQAARLELGQALAIAPPKHRGPGGWPPDAWRARLAGSLTWCDLLLGLSGGLPGMTSQDRLDVADELLRSARELRATRAIHAALTRQAWAQMALGRIEDSERTVIEWYRLARSTGRDMAAAYACLWLAEFAWRQDDPARAAPWMEAAHRLVDDLPAEHSMRANVALHDIVIEAVRGDANAGIARFVALPARFIATVRRSSLEHLVEAAALLARKSKLDHLASALAQSLAVLSDIKDDVALVNDFRVRHLGTVPPRPEGGVADAEAVVRRARADLQTLHDYWSAAKPAR